MKQAHFAPSIRRIQQFVGHNYVCPGALYFSNCSVW